MGEYRDQGHLIASLIGVVSASLMHLLVGAFVFPSGLVTPGWAWAALVTLWFLGAWLIWYWRRSPVRAMLVPVAMAAIWWTTLTLGDVLLGWTA